MQVGRARWVWSLSSAALLLACGGRAELDAPGAGASSMATSGGAAASGANATAAGTGGSSGEGGSLHGRIATVETSTSELAIYPPNPVAGSAPLARIGGMIEQEYCPDLAFDSRANLYLICDTSPSDDPAHIDVFAPDTTGEATPSRRISGMDTTLGGDGLVRLGIDGAGSIHLLQVNYTAYPAIGVLTVFAPDAAGDASPIHTALITGDGIASPNALALDASGQVLVGYSWSGMVRVFAANADGTPAPIREFGTNVDDGSEGIIDLAVDDSGLIYVLTSVQLRVYGPSAANDDPPLRVVTFDIDAPPAGLDVAKDGRVFLATGEGVSVLSASANGAAMPLFTFGTATKNAIAIAP